MNNILILLLAIIIVLQLLILSRGARHGGKLNIDKHIDRLNKSQQLENLNQSTRIDGQLANVNRMLEANSKRSEAYMNQVFDVIEQNQENRIQKLVAENNKLNEKLIKLSTVAPSIDRLNDHINELELILGDKKTRGSFGEIQMYSIVQNFYGVSDYVNKQYKLSTGAIVDLAIKSIGHQKLLCIDSKFPLENYKRIADDSNYIKDFQRDVKKHIKDIASKYIIVNETVGFALMFVPSEVIYQEIIADVELVNFANANKVWYVSPSTLVITMQLIENLAVDYIRQENANEIESDINNLGVEFDRFNKRYEQLERHLRQVVNDMNDISVTHKKLSSKFDQISSRNR